MIENFFFLQLKAFEALTCRHKFIFKFLKRIDTTTFYHQYA